MMKKVKGYLDASGKQETLGDKVLVVAVSLATPFYWQEFSKEWIAHLIEKGYPIETGKTVPFFHTAQFHYGKYPFREVGGWDDERKQDLYDGLIRLIKKRTEYSVAIGVDLEDYRRFAAKYPASQDMWASAGGFAFALCLWKCREWAESFNYQETIPYIYDRGDKFADEMREEYDELCKESDRAKWWYFTPGGLTDGDKEEHIPIQSADIVAWEVAKDFKRVQVADPLSDFQSRSELMQLSYIGAEYKMYGYEDFVGFWLEHEEGIMDHLRKSVKRKGLIQDDSEFDEAYARFLINMPKEEFKRHIAAEKEE